MEEGKRAFDAGDFRGAKKLFKQAKDLQVTPYKDQLYLASLLNNLGECYRKLAADPAYTPDTNDQEEKNITSNRDLYAVAESYLKDSIAIKEKALGRYSVVLATGLENLGSVYLDDDQLEESEALFRKALAIREEKQGLGHCDTASDYVRLGEIALNDARRSYVEAAKDYKTALRIYEHCSKPNEAILGTCHGKLALTYYTMNQLEDACEHYDIALSIFAMHLPKTKSQLDALKSELQQLPQDMYAKAANELRDMKSSLPARSPQLIPFLKKLDLAARRAGKLDDAAYSERYLKRIDVI
jgi:tetratricopeptide (TPR) repeat protein